MDSTGNAFAKILLDCVAEALKFIYMNDINSNRYDARLEKLNGQRGVRT